MLLVMGEELPLPVGVVYICQRLKDIEDKWICRLGTFNPPNGLNTRDEIKTRSRVNFSKQNSFI